MVFLSSTLLSHNYIFFLFIVGAKCHGMQVAVGRRHVRHSSLLLPQRSAEDSHQVPECHLTGTEMIILNKLTP